MYAINGNRMYAQLECYIFASIQAQSSFLCQNKYSSTQHNHCKNCTNRVVPLGEGVDLESIITVRSTL